MVGNVLPETLENSADMVPYSELIVELAGGAGMLNIWQEERFFKVKKRVREHRFQTIYRISHLLQQLILTCTVKLTSVELHEGRDQLFDRQRVVLHHFRESLSARLYSRVGDKQHLHQLGDKVGVPDVVLTADEHHQKGDNVLDTWLI